MRIAYLVNTYPRVSHTFIRREIGALERLGVEIGRYCLRGTPDTLVDADDKRELSKTRVVLDAGAPRLLSAVVKTAATRSRRTLRALRTALRLAAVSDRGTLAHIAYVAEACVLLDWMRRDGTEHVHAHFGTNSAAVALLVHQLGGPSFSLTVHGPEEFDNPVLLSLRQKLTEAAFAVGVSSYGRSQLYRHCPHSQWSKIHVVHCGVDSRLLSSEPKPLPAAHRLVSVARLSEQKGQLLLIEAIARARTSIPDLELVLVGDGELRGVIEARISELGLDECVSITGWADTNRVRAELDAARVFVLPSFAEGLPVALMEALAAGRPVVTTNVAGIAELVDSECGWLIPAGSVDKLTEAITQALESPVERLEEMGRKGRMRVRQQHDVDTEAAILKTLMEQAVAGQQETPTATREANNARVEQSGIAG